MTHEKALETSRKDENVNPTDIVGGARGLSVSGGVQIFASVSKPRGGLKAALMGSEISLKLQKRQNFAFKPWRIVPRRNIAGMRAEIDPRLRPCYRDVEL